MPLCQQLFALPSTGVARTLTFQVGSDFDLVLAIELFDCTYRRRRGFDGTEDAGVPHTFEAETGGGAAASRIERV
jgi:hypothetical protein